VTELVVPLEMLLVREENLKSTTNDNRPPKDQTAGSTVKAAARQTLVEQVCAQNQVIAVVGSKKRHRSSQEQQFLSTATATNEETIYKNSGDDARVERERKALKTNEVSCTATGVLCLAKLRLQHKSPNQIVTPSRSSNQSATTRNNNNPSHATFLIKQNAHSWRYESCELSNAKVMELLKNTSPTFRKRIDELRVFKAKFGHCNVTTSKSASNKPYFLLGRWCSQTRQNRMLMEEGKLKRKVSKDQIAILDILGFEWGDLKRPFNKRIEELRAFKAKFGHCNATTSQSISNKPYVLLGRWCSQVRQSRRLMEEGKPTKLSKDQIASLDALGFQWGVKNPFNKRIEELRAFKAEFGHCNVSASQSFSNKPYVSLGRWCSQVRQSRRLMNEGKPTERELSKDQIESLDSLGFQWEIKPFE
jgi:hypothetical protein